MDEDMAKKPNKKRIIILLAVLFLLLVVGIFVYKNRIENKVFSKYTVLNKYELDNGTDAKYLQYADGMLRYTTDGISYYADGREVWNKAIDVKVPLIDTCEDYVVIADKSTNNINLIDVSGNQTIITSTYPVIGVDVARQGVVAATLDDGTANYIEMTDSTGSRIAWGRTVLQQDGYPLDISLSNDGTKLAASYLAVTSGTTQSKVVFYNYSEIGQNEVDRVVGGFNQYKSTIVPKVEFINNNYTAAFGDNMFTIYKMNEKPKIVKEDSFTDKITSVFYNSKYIGMVFENSDGSGSKTLKVYDTNGDKKFQESLDYSYNDITFAGNSVFMYNDNSCRLISLAGVNRFDYKFKEAIQKIIPISDEKYMVVYDNRVEEIKLK